MIAVVSIKAIIAVLHIVWTILRFTVTALRSKVESYNMLWLALVLMMGLNISSLLTVGRL